MKAGVCHECCRYFDTNEARIIAIEIWECPYCQYPNSKEDLGID